MASRSSYRSRSTFDDPAGLDPSFRVGQSVGGLLGKRGIAGVLEEKVSSYFRNRKRRSTSSDPKFDRPQQSEMQRKGKKRSRSSSARPAKRRRGSVRRASVSRTRSRSKGFTKRLRKLRTKFRRTGRYNYGYRTSAVKKQFYRRFFQKCVTFPIRLDQEVCSTMANIGDNLQNLCSWLPLALLGPGTIDNLLSAASGISDVTDIQSGFHCGLEKGNMSVQIKNASNHRADVTVYRLTPRSDWPLALYSPVQGTINPQWIQDAFSDLTRSNVLTPDTRLHAYNEHDADPFKSDMTGMFKIKKILRKFLPPGGFFSFSTNMKNRMLSKSKFGIIKDNATLAGTWGWHRKFGSLYLIRAQGPIIHDEAKNFDGTARTYPVTDQNPIGLNAGLNQGTNAYKMTTGGYAVDVYIRRRWNMITSPLSQNDVAYGTITARLPQNITRANEQTWEFRVPQEDQPAY